MSGPTAAYGAKVEIAPDSTGSAGSYAALGDQTKVTVTVKGEQIDITQLNSAGYRSKLAGLIDADVKLEAFSEYGDTAQGTLKTAITTRVPVWIKVTYESSHHITLSCMITDLQFDIDPAGAGKVSYSGSLAGQQSSPLAFS